MSTTTAERPRLRELRLEQGWTQQEVADRMARLAWSRSGQEQPIGVTADMVAKWERGAKGISPRYRALLAGVYKVTVDQLGLPGLARGQADRRDDRSLVAIVDQAAELLSQLGDAGRAIRPQILAALTDDVLSRRTTLSILDAPAPVHSSPTLAELDALADQYEAAFGTAAPTALMTALTAHLRMLGEALTHGPSEGTRQRLLRNRARVAILAGRLAADRLANPMVARAHYSLAVDDAYELADRALEAVAHNHAARVALAEGQPAAGRRHLENAARVEAMHLPA